MYPIVNDMDLLSFFDVFEMYLEGKIEEIFKDFYLNWVFQMLLKCWLYSGGGWRPVVDWWWL